MTDQQKDQLTRLLKRLEASRFRHGDCIGADAEAHEIALSLGIPVVTHPSLHPDRAMTEGAQFIHEPKPPLERNQDIVDSSEVLIATPGGFSEVQRSGTWSTIRRARKRKKAMAIIYPDGTTGHEAL